MEELVGKYINPFTDYGFKYLFGTEPNKEFTLTQSMAKGMAKGRAKGVEMTKREDARKMKDLGMSYDIISQVTGLDRDLIASL